MKFGIDIGHNCPPDTGAVGIQREDVLTMDVGTRLIQKLRQAGHTVVECKPSSASSVVDSLRRRVYKANQERVDVFVSIHFNAFNRIANGSEVYAISNRGRAIATPVLIEIIKQGFRNRGVKSANFLVLKDTKMPAILIECCFCDSQTDMRLFDAEKMAEAIRVGLIGQPTDLSKKYVLNVTRQTFLKPSTEQSADLPPGSSIELAPGNYPILDFSFEEGHYWIEWPDESKGKRREHFVYGGHGKVTEA